MRKPVPRSIDLKGIGTPPLRLAFLLVLALSGCTTFKPPQISYDDDVPPSPDLPMPADDHARPLHVPPSWTPARGGRKGDEEAKEPAERITTANDAARVEPGVVEAGVKIGEVPANAGGARRIAKGRHREMVADHQGGRHQGGVITQGAAGLVALQSASRLCGPR